MNTQGNLAGNQPVVAMAFDKSSLDYQIDENGKPWFKLADIAKVLDMDDSSVRKMKQNGWFDEDEMNTVKNCHGTPGNPYQTYVSESALYRILNRSNSPKARPFERWVTKEVLPSIRKTGSYSTPKATPNTNHTDGSVDWQGVQAILATQYKGNQLTLAMDNVYKANHNGASVLEMSGTQLVNPVQEMYYAPKYLGKMVEPNLTSQRVNQCFASLGLQEKIAGTWKPTIEGKKHCIIVDTGKRYHNGASIPQIKWYADDFILKALQAFTAAM